MLLSALFILIFAHSDVPIRKASVLKEANKFSIQADTINPDAVATATFEDGLEITGWGILELETNSEYDDFDQAFAAGMIEGYLTAKRIADHEKNVQNVMFGKYQGKPPPEVSTFLSEQEEWTNQQVTALSDTSAIWHQVGAIQNQYRGLIDGYNIAASYEGLHMLSNLTFAVLNGIGDLFQIMPAVIPGERISWYNISRPKARHLFHQRTHCSAIVKVLGDLSDLMFGHSSWFDFSHTNRIFKTYTLNFKHASTKSPRMSFSSYPGYLESLDDFYMMSSGLGMTQTSNEIFETSLLDLITPKSLLAWQRVRLANMMATTGEEWQKYFSTHPSGTYVNQYMIVDMNLFSPGKDLVNGTLYVVEEMPGLILGDDMTQQLERGHWPSYNVPYFYEIWSKSGYKNMNSLSANGYYSYQLAPRAKIFRRDAGSVHDLDGMKRILRYNDYKNDPYAFDGTGQDPYYAICSRGDLKSQNPSNDGCYDTKVTSFQYGFSHQKADILNGPTLGNGDLPAFSWSGKSQLHQGLPEIYNFSFITIHADEM